MGAEISQPGRRRREGRLCAELAARFETLHGNLLLSIIDLSESGARLRPHSPVLVGSEGVLNWLQFEAFGEVKWVKDGFVGIEFDRPVEPAVLFQTRRQFDQGLAPNEEEAQEQQAEKWFNGSR